MPLTDFAAAKINLFLHVLFRRPDGYHEIESLVAFADVGDRLTLDPAKPLALEIVGRFAKDCGEEEGNSILKAARALQLRLPHLKLGAFTLEKNLPVAAGLGGGSANAAAALRLLAKENGIAENDKNISDAALHAGADVPVCLKSKPALMRGIGEKISLAAVPSCAAVLVNCGKPLLTRDVFAKFSLPANRESEDIEMPENFQGLVALLKRKANDLIDVARILCPEIAQVERAIDGTGAALIRLSGSGATVFGLYGARKEAESAALVLRRQNPHWWVKAATLAKL